MKNKQYYLLEQFYSENQTIHIGFIDTWKVPV